VQSISSLQVESIVLGDDCALLGQDNSVGRRGMCGMVFIFKVNLSIAKNRCGLLHNWKVILTMILRETCGIYGRQIHMGIGFSLGTSFNPFQMSVH
jgi:hypothetical protein